ncbi:aryl hydrocarbon receptor-like [Phaenicophaeus curvirostris]|uniref:aryl hydrocarbon receptor-like n=1 Tax=Phaenicophaeus curvirostris TaxID=33595 RepID=UPI0037F0CBB5
MHQSVFELIHTEDQQEFRRNLHWALNPPHAPEGEPSPEEGKSLRSSAVPYKLEQLPPENSSFLERSFVCRFRCLLENSSGFLVSTDLVCGLHSSRGADLPGGVHSAAGA